MWLPSASHHRADRGVRHELRAFPGAPGQGCHPRGRGMVGQYRAPCLSQGHVPARL